MTDKGPSSDAGLIDRMANWGYFLLPKAHDDSPGHTGLLIAVREAPTYTHFDPESICLHVLGEEGTPIEVRLSLGLHSRRSERVTPCRVLVRDRVEKVVEFFTFGGWMEAVSEPGETVYSLRSPAPILVLTHPESVPDLLAAETEAMLARIDAQWGMDDEGFEERLAGLDPLQLYVASVHSILAHIKSSPELRDDLAELYHVLVEERTWLRESGQWPAQPPTLGKLLATGAP
jgi:hypothetical protein